MDSDCFICKKHNGELKNTTPVYEDDLFYVNHIIPDGHKAYLGHMFIETKRHVKSVGLLSDEESSQLGILLRNLGKVFTDSFGADHVYSFILGDEVPHFHAHVVPRYKNTPQEYWGMKVFEWPDAPRGGG